MKIEWDSDFHSDGRRRSRPKASTVHGWLAKMRGTLLGNERLRSAGMREMREAKAIRRIKSERSAQRRAKTGMGFLNFSSNTKKRSPPQRQLSRRDTGRSTVSRSNTRASSRRTGPPPPVSRRPTNPPVRRGSRATQRSSGRPSTSRRRTT